MLDECVMSSLSFIVQQSFRWDTHDRQAIESTLDDIQSICLGASTWHAI